MTAAGTVHDGPFPAARFSALGTTATVLTTEATTLDDAAAAVRAEVEAFDQACSRFREDSELSRVNQASGATMVVSSLLVEAVMVALRAARLTGGLVDPTVGAALQRLGYDRDFAGVSRTGGCIQVTVRPVAGWQTVELEPADRTIRLPAGVFLDLGATAKALCADRAAAAGVAAAGRGGVLVNLGGDISVCGASPAGGWTVRAMDDHQGPDDAPGQTVSIKSGGLATSGTSVRRWTRGEREVHHIVDPARSQPVSSPWRTASVAARSCVDANTASTAAILLGDGATKWLEARSLPARLVGRDGAVVTVAGWPAEQC